MTALAIAHRAGRRWQGSSRRTTSAWTSSSATSTRTRVAWRVRHLKTAGPLPFLWDRWELASAAAPRLGLAELLDAGRHDVTVMVDLKGRRTSAARSVAELIHDTQRHRDVLVCGRHWASVNTVSVLPYVRPVLSARTQSELTRLLRRLESASPELPAGSSVHRSLLDAATVAD